MFLSTVSSNSYENHKNHGVSKYVLPNSVQNTIISRQQRSIVAYRCELKNIMYFVYVSSKLTTYNSYYNLLLHFAVQTFFILFHILFLVVKKKVPLLILFLIIVRRECFPCIDKNHFSLLIYFNCSSRNSHGLHF